MHTSLFTVFLEYLGGTYIGQIRADSPNAAVQGWLAGQTEANLKLWKLNRNLLTEALGTQSPVPLDGLKNAWCVTASLPNGLVLINIVLTGTDK